jgi:RNA polymerase-binding transcription factor DksA
MTERTSGRSPSEQAVIEEALAAERASTTQQIADLSRDLGGIIEASTSVATDDEHDPEGSTIAFERAQVAALLTRARGRLEDLDRAMDRLRDGNYGMCEGCGQPIAAERLAARPSASTCITCASGRRR